MGEQRKHSSSGSFFLSLLFLSACFFFFLSPISLSSLSYYVHPLSKHYFNEKISSIELVFLTQQKREEEKERERRENKRERKKERRKNKIEMRKEKKD